MKTLYLALLFSSILVSGCMSDISITKIAKNGTKYNFFIYDEIPKPFVPEDNQLTQEKVELGRHLFYDKRLSANNTFSCASCHDQKKAFSENKAVAEGVFKDKHSKNSMSLTNVGYSSVLTWGNPNLHKLETQMLIPMFGDTPPELGLKGKEQELIEKISTVDKYKSLFSKAFPSENSPVTIENITKSIASFERVLVSFKSPYDKYEFGKDSNALSESAKRGLTLFFSEKLECFHCHGGFNFSDSTRHEKTTFIEYGFHNNGLYNVNNENKYPPNGNGIADITLRKEDLGKFKAPTLRNIEVTAPYMHDGSIATLEEVIEHYSRGGRVIKEGALQGDGAKNINKSGFIKGFNLSESEKKDVIEFLKSLTDKDFLENSAFSDPWN